MALHEMSGTSLHAVAQDLGYMVNKMYKCLGGTLIRTLDFEDETFRVGHS